MAVETNSTAPDERPNGARGSDSSVQVSASAPGPETTPTASPKTSALPTAAPPGDRAIRKADTALPGATGRTLESVTTPVQANVKTITIIVLTTLACVTLFGGILFKLFVTPEWIDKQLGISDQVKKTLWKEVDSGYSTTVVFHKGNTAGDSSLEFYCEPDQKVELFVASDATGFPPSDAPKVTIQLNGTPIDFGLTEITAGLPHTNAPKDVTELLKGQRVREKLQTIRISSDNANKYPDSFLVINLLVLVSNNVDKH